MTVLRRGYVPVEPDTSGFDEKLREQFTKQDPGGRAGKQIGGQLNRALKRVNIDPIDIKADPRQALAKIRETEERLRQLSGDSATVEVKIRTEKAMSELRRFKRQLGDTGHKEGGDSAEAFSASFSSKLGPLLAKAPVSPQLVVAAAAAAPVIAASMSAAVIGAAGVGGVIGGLLLVKDDPRVAAAGQELGNKLLSNLKTDAEPFVEPVLAAVAKIEGRFDQMNGRIKSIFASSSGFLDPLVNGALGGVDGILKGIESLVTKGKPVIDALGNSFSIIGSSVGKAMSVISGDSDDAARALTAIAKSAGALIVTVGYLVRAMTELFGVITYLPRKFREAEFAVAGLVGINKEMSVGASDAAASVAAQVVVLAKNAAASNAAATAATSFVASQDNVKAASAAATLAQQEFTHGLDSLSGRLGVARQQSDALRKAQESLYGAQIAATDANEAYQASWDDLSGAIRQNGRSLDIHTAAGRSNRDALEGLLQKNNELYLADIAAGVSVDKARVAHEKRTAAVEKESGKLHLNRQATADLIGTYGKIPPTKTTDLVLDGVRQVVHALEQLYIYQRSLATGKSIASVEQSLRKGNDNGPAKAGGGFADGGQIGGWSPHSKADNIPAWLTAKEWVHPVDAVDYYGPQIMGAIQHRQVPREVLAGFATGQLGKLGDLPLGLAAGGQVAHVDTSRRWPFHTNVSGTRIPSRAEVASKVPLGGAAGPFLRAQNGKPYGWANAGPGSYDCSGIVSAVYELLHGRSPYHHVFSTGSLPGSWFPKSGIGGPLTAAWSNPGEAPASSTTGHMMGMVNGLTFESSGSRGVHLGASTRRLTDFAHIAHYALGGQVPKFDMGGTLAPGLNTVYNGLGRPEPLVPAGATTVVNYTINYQAGPVSHPAEDGRKIVERIKAFEQGNGSRWRG